MHIHIYLNICMYIYIYHMLSIRGGIYIVYINIYIYICIYWIRQRDINGPWLEGHALGLRGLTDLLEYLSQKDGALKTTMVDAKSIVSTNRSTQSCIPNIPEATRAIVWPTSNVSSTKHV